MLARASLPPIYLHLLTFIYDLLVFADAALLTAPGADASGDAQWRDHGAHGIVNEFLQAPCQLKKN